jgi:hypothetical protein
MKGKPVFSAILAFLTLGGAVFFAMAMRGSWPPTSREWFMSIGAGLLAGSAGVFLLLFPAESGELRQQVVELANAVLSVRSGTLNYSQPPAAPKALTLEDRVIAALVQAGYKESTAIAMVSENLKAAAAFAGIGTGEES